MQELPMPSSIQGKGGSVSELPEERGRVGCEMPDEGLRKGNLCGRLILGRTSRCWQPLARKLQRRKKMSDTPTHREAAESGLSRHALLADLYWLEYQDAAEDARSALRNGDKLKALALAIQAYKIKGQYEYYASRLIFG
jgi:hypothetical protein